MQQCTTNAMKALMDLSNGNTSSAIHNGYSAYGQYQNSGQMDNMRLTNAISALHMDSITSYLSSNGGSSSPLMAPVSSYSTDFGRLDSSFLRQGEAGQVADQFEKATGMSRDAFLKAMAQASESTISASDPQLVDKVLSRFENFLQDIPNQDFRNKVQATIDSVPSTVRTGVLSKAIQKGVQLLAGSDSGKSDIAVADKNKAGQASASPAAAAADGNGTTKAAEPGEDRTLASLSPALVGRAEYRGIDYEKLGNDAVGSSLQTALDEQGGDDTIFKQISRKYRSLTATLFKPQSI
jgi:hypothetical protein